MKKVMQIAGWFIPGSSGAATQCRLTVACILGVLSLTAAASGTLPKLKVSDNRRFLATAEGKPFFSRIPDPLLIVDDAVKSLVPGAGTRRYASTRDIEGTYAFVYAPVGRDFTVSFANLRAERYEAAWMNPRTGEYSAWESFDRPDTRRFTPPAPGELLDWVLVIRKVK